MKKALILILCVLSTSLVAQQRFKGYPSRSGEIDIRTQFATPPKGYGNVPFYWWNGDSLKRDRLEAQLQILQDASIDGFAVSYIHSHPKVDLKLNANGYGGFGKAIPGAPGVFTDEWWNIWNWFSGKCAEKGMGLGLDDYVLGWERNGYYIDELLKDSSFTNYKGRLKFEIHPVPKGQQLSLALSANPLQIVAYPGATELNKQVKDNKLSWKAPADKDYKVYIIYTQPSHELHPEYGSRLIDVYFDRFRKRMDSEGVEGMNYFFQDELHYQLNMHSWAEDMPQEFLKRKGYNILPYLPALKEDIGDITPKIRMDYAEVLTQLSEERYFEPIFDWHANQGLIYGCDNNGRGLEPTEYVDYFRTMSWFTAPGNDAPARGSSFRQTKVSSSISHLYERPRTWLEAFHSMGWDSNGEWLTQQLDHHIMAGGNLLCLHGLYYSTHGGWWEWAPPCFHFRMPYWPHMKKWLQYAQRLNFVLSQGVHVCDIAVMYPTESMQAYPNANGEVMWKLTDELSISGLDYDFIDYQSLQKAEIIDKELSISGERYKVLILADMKALHHETLLKILDFRRKGGIVLATGALPIATTQSGANNPEVKAILDEIFHSPSAIGKGFFEKDYTALLILIPTLITPDITVNTNHCRVLHHKIGNQDVYMVSDVAKNSEMFFRATGKVECWHAKDGSIVPQPVLEQNKKGTRIRFEGETGTSILLVFSPGIPVYASSTDEEWITEKTTPITGNWDIQIIPTMQNKWGDFRLPASDEYIGAEAREFAYKQNTHNKKSTSAPRMVASTPRDLYGYSPYFQTITLPATTKPEDCISPSIDDAIWQPYSFSWQYGVRDNPGGQGYHGLKGITDDRFIILDQGGHQLFRTFTYAPQTCWYRIEQEGVIPDYLCVDKQRINGNRVMLKQGWHSLLLVYTNTTKGHYILAEKQSYSTDDRKRSAVVIYSESHPQLKETTPNDSIVSMKWFNTAHLPYNPYGEKDNTWQYEFQTAPGTKKMELNLKGELLQLWIDGKEISKKNWTQLSDRDKYEIAMPKINRGISTVHLIAKPEKGYHGSAIFALPVKLTCVDGQMLVGDWSTCGALKYYSGGINYKKTIHINETLVNRKVILDLGMVDATCEVMINGKQADILMNPPFRLDITHLLAQGDNAVEVLVYSSLSNHYQEIPSAYRGQPRAGLIGPVELIWHKK